MKHKKISIISLAILALTLSACSTTSDSQNENSDDSQAIAGSSESYPTRTFVISFNSNGGSPINSVEVKEGEFLSRPIDPVKEGFDFAGWYKNSNLTKEYDFSMPVRESFILYAKWVASIPDTYTVTFINDGKEVDKQEVANSELLEEPESPSKEGYVFLGWFISGSNEKFDFSTPVTSSFTLYAKWSTQEYLVTFNLNYDNLPAVQYSTENGLITFVPQRDGYVFNGWWYCDGVINGAPILNRSFSLQTKVTSDNLELFAEWIEQKQYANQLDTPVVSIDNNVISWDEIDNASSYQIIITARVGNTTQTFEDTRIYSTSYLFDSTYDANAYTIKVRAIGDGVNYRNSSYATKTLPHKTLTAPRNFSYNEYKCILQWDKVINASYYTIKINNDTEISTYDNYYDFTNFDAGSYSLKITPVRESWLSSATNYSFTKWYLKAPTVKAIYDEANERYNVTWTSSLEADSYKIFINGDEVITTSENSYILPMDSYYFVDEHLSISVAAFDSNSDYFISPQSNELSLIKIYKITYILDGGTNFSSNPSTYTIETPTIVLGAPVKTGYTFTGWTNGDSLIDSIPTGSTGNLTLTANWDVNAYAITLDANGGTCSESSISVVYGSEYSLPTPTRLGYTFSGWYDRSTKINDSGIWTYTLDKTFVAKWKIINYSITYILNGGTNNLFNPSTYTIEDNLDLQEPTYQFGSFDGWYLNEEKITSISKGTIGNLVLEAKWSQTQQQKEEETQAWNIAHGVIPSLSENGRTITYGLYPQTNVNDPSLVSSLNSLTTPESNGWYLYEREYYTKVSATRYGSSYFNNGTRIESGTTYWFKCEPITWNVLSNTNGEYYLLSSTLLDVHCYYDSTSRRTIDDTTIYANNYEYSDIRTWLNNDFYNSAFALDNSYIKTTTVDNSRSTTESTYNYYACNDTQDKVFLPSYKDYINPSYGFSTSTDSTSARYCKTTDWARARGASYNNSASYLYNGSYWTRSPIYHYYQYSGGAEIMMSGENSAWRIGSDGSFQNGNMGSGYVTNKHDCVRPSLSIIIA